MGFFGDLLSGATSFLTGGGFFGSLLNAGLGMLGSSQSNSNQLAAMREQNNFNAQEAEKQRNWQSQEWKDQFRAQTDWQHQEWQSQFRAQSNEWYNQQDYANEQAYNYWLQQQQYNSPAANVQRMNEAGFNASAAANAQQFGGTGLQAAPTSVPTASAPAAPSGGAVQGAAASSSGIPQMKSFADFVDAFSSASLKDSQSKEVLTLLSGKFRKQMLENDTLENLRDISKIDAIWKERFKRKEYNQLVASIDKIEKEAAMALSLTGKYDSEKLLADARTLYEKESAGLKGEEFRLFNLTFNLRIKMIEEQLRNLQQDTEVKGSQVVSNKAQANFYNATAANQLAQADLNGEQFKQLKESHEANVAFASIRNKVAEVQAEGLSLDNLLKDKSMQDNLRIIAEQAKRAGIVTEQATQELEKAIKENNVFYLNQVLNATQVISGNIRDVGVGVGSVLNSLKPW